MSFCVSPVNYSDSDSDLFDGKVSLGCISQFSGERLQDHWSSCFHTVSRWGESPPNWRLVCLQNGRHSPIEGHLIFRRCFSIFKDILSDILVFNLGNVPGFHLIRAKVGGVFKLKFHTTYRNMIIYSSRLDTQNPDVTVQRISTFKHVQAHVLIYLWFRNV